MFGVWQMRSLMLSNIAANTLAYEGKFGVQLGIKITHNKQLGSDGSGFCKLLNSAPYVEPLGKEALLCSRTGLTTPGMLVYCQQLD